ncbi:MAG TPA: hypothetical protein ENG03_09210 [Thioploca sp.]|nr:hypothetical protein [Thioploca sp.]
MSIAIFSCKLKTVPFTNPICVVTIDNAEPFLSQARYGQNPKALLVPQSRIKAVKVVCIYRVFSGSL